MLQEEGASTDVTGNNVFLIASMTEGNGSRTSPEKLNPEVNQQQLWQQNDRRTEYGINHMMRFIHSRGEIVRERDLKVLQLCS